MWTFKPRRIALLANVATAVSPPGCCQVVEIGNATPDDVKVYEDPTDESTYLVIVSGYAKLIDLKQHRFRPDEVAFYLKAAQAGTVVLLWQ